MGQRLSTGAIRAPVPETRARRCLSESVDGPREEQQIQRLIRDTCSDQLKLSFALLTVAAVQELIEREWGKRPALSTVRLYLQRWGFTPQNPLARANERCPTHLQRWLAAEYSALVRGVKKQKTLIYWGNETGVCNQDQIGECRAT